MMTVLFLIGGLTRSGRTPSASPPGKYLFFPSLLPWPLLLPLTLLLLLFLFIPGALSLPPSPPSPIASFRITPSRTTAFFILLRFAIWSGVSSLAFLLLGGLAGPWLSSSLGFQCGTNPPPPESIHLDSGDFSTLTFISIF